MIIEYLATTRLPRFLICCRSCTLFIAIKPCIGSELNRDYLNFANDFKVAF